MDELTRDDILLLIEAVEAWESKRIGNHFMRDLLGVFSAKNQEEAEQIIKDQEIRNKAQEEKLQHEMETATLIKAKLIGMKNKLMG